MSLDFKKLRVYDTEEKCRWACGNSPVRRTPIQLKNGRWAAMTFDEQMQYARLRSGMAVYAKRYRDEVASINKNIKEARRVKNNEN